MTTPQYTRAELLSEYDRLMRQMVKAGLEPVLTDAVLDVFTTTELRYLIKSEALRLMRYRSLAAER